MALMSTGQTIGLLSDRTGIGLFCLSLVLRMGRPYQAIMDIIGQVLCMLNILTILEARGSFSMKGMNTICRLILEILG